MKELLEKILGEIKKTPEGVRAYEDLYHICLETQKTDIPLSVEYLKKLSDIIENRIPQSETDKELRSLFMLHKKVLLAAAPFDFESYLLYVEWEREPDKKFYVPRREVMHPVVQAMQDLIDDRLDLLTISMPPGTGKSTLGIFFLSWVMGRFPDSQSLASAHSGMLTRSFYDGVYQIITDSEYLWADVFPGVKLAATNSKEETIDLHKKHRFSSHTVGVGISLWKNGWSSISSFVGTSVSVGISLFKSGWTSIKKFFGLANGGIVGANGGVKMFASGGIITPNMWKAMPKYAGGTNRAHGSMFVAGESGAELVGHVNGTTEVLNRFQLASVMHSSIVSGMAQFSGYWQSMSRDIVTCANGIINAVVVSTAGINENLVLASASGYDPYNSLAQTVYEDSKKSYDGAYSDDSWSRNMREFYHEYVEPTLKEIATDTKRQADKKEQTIVKVGNRTINDAVTTQKEANGFSFTE